MSGREKLEGMDFGDFKAIEYIGHKKYLVRCNICDEEKEILACNMKKGIGVICSTKKKEVVDLAGKNIGEWEVLEYIGNKKYKCRCSCGTIKEVLKANLLNGSSTSCGHNKNHYGDLTGRVFGEWEVLEKDNYLWKCRCSCGTIRSISSTDLASGKTKSCGHSYNKFIDISGKRFGHWSTIKYCGNQQYLCECDCENKTRRLIKKADLISGRSASCGCSKASKSKETLLMRYGEIGPNRTSEPRTIEQIQAVLSSEQLSEFIDELDYKPTSLELSDELGIKLHRTLKIIHNYNLEDKIIIDSRKSYSEKELASFIMDIHKGEVQVNNRSILDGKELDIYIPEEKIAIEYNGVYWHSSAFKDQKYHQEKTLQCEALGIQLIHIFEHEWKNNRDKIEMYLKNRIIKQKRKIFGRNTRVIEINTEEAKEFCEKYHLQGWVGAQINIGLYNKDELVSVMTFTEPRFSDKYEYEIARYCVKDNTNIIGGAQKLIKYFISEYKPKNIITYSDLSKFNGNIYREIGFNEIEITHPNYTWISSDLEKVLSRYQTQKHRLIEYGMGTDEQTEDDIMYGNNFLKVYDCGSRKFAWENPN